MAIGLNHDSDIATPGKDSVIAVGSIMISTRGSKPEGFLECDGSNTVSRAAYARLFNVLVPNKGTVTISSATSGVVTLNNHGFLTGESIFLTTTGALPSNLSANTLYFVINTGTNTFNLATTYTNATATSPIAINTASGVQSGTHTLFFCPYGLGSDTNNFKLPDFRNATIRGRGLSTGFTSGNNLMTSLGYLEEDRMQGHWHSVSHSALTNNGSWQVSAGSAANQSIPWATISVLNPTTDGTNGTPRTAKETRMKNQGVSFFIKF